MTMDTVCKIDGKVQSIRSCKGSTVYTENGPVYLGPKFGGVRFGSAVVRGKNGRFERQTVTIDLEGIDNEDTKRKDYQS